MTDGGVFCGVSNTTLLANLCSGNLPSCISSKLEPVLKYS